MQLTPSPLVKLHPHLRVRDRHGRVRALVPSYGSPVSGQTTPIRLMADELGSAWSLGWKLLRGTFVRYRNISHYRVIASFLDWVRGKARFPTPFEAIGPTLELLDAIEARIPSYQAKGERAASTQTANQDGQRGE